MQIDIHPSISKAVTPDIAEWAAGRWSSKLGPTLEFFRRFYHEPLSSLVDLSTVDAAECASGAGLNAIAFVLSGGRSIVGYDKTEERVRFANDLAERLGIADRARFELLDISDVPETQVDVFFSLQTLEHVPHPLEALRRMGQVSRRAVVVSTPNQWWPRDGHDTGLMFAHWTPDRFRRRYAVARGARSDQFCRFLSPLEIAETLVGFERVTGFYNFSNPKSWTERFPTYFPYGEGGGRYLPARSANPKWRIASAVFDLVPDVARNFAPMNEGIYLRQS